MTPNEQEVADLPTIYHNYSYRLLATYQEIADLNLGAGCRRPPEAGKAPLLQRRPVRVWRIQIPPVAGKPLAPTNLINPTLISHLKI